MDGNAKILHWDDLGYSVAHQLHENGLVMEFKLYTQLYTDSADGMRYYERPGVTTPCENPVREDGMHNSALVRAEGSVKWDGCSNIKFPETDEVMLHFCSKEAVEQFGQALARLYDLAKNMIGERWLA